MKRGQGLRRRTAFRTPKVKYTLFSEGANTEPAYFRAFGSRFSGTVLELRIVPAAGVPKTIAEKARAELQSSRRAGVKGRSFAASDEVWAIFDRDRHPNVEEAIQICRGAGVRVAFSDPCFELWLVLHVEEFDRLVDHQFLQKHCENVCSGYCRSDGKTADCNALIAGYDQAALRARRQYGRRLEEGTPPRPPYTTVYELTEAIRNAAEKFGAGRPS